MNEFLDLFTDFFNDGMTMGKDKFRKLPELAKPSLYKIRLAPCLKTFKCPGEASIQLEVGARFTDQHSCS